MLRIVVVDSSAEARTRITNRLTSYLSSGIKEAALLPPLSVQPISLQELKFRAAPDICIIGDELISQEFAAVGIIRKLIPSSVLIAQLSSEIETFSFIEELALSGIDDTISSTAEPFEFFKKIILLSKKKTQQGGGTLIVVDSGKGGVGVSTVVAGLGETFANEGYQTCLLDCDFETQDLSRFLMVRPFINENLQLLFDGSRPVTDESVQQCVTPVWSDHDNLSCITPISDNDTIYDSDSKYPRIALSLLEVLDQSYDVVIVDIGCARGAFRKALHRVADLVVFVVNGDPATLYPSVHKISQLKDISGSAGKLLVIENGTPRGTLKHEFIKREILAASKIDESDWFGYPIPFHRQAGRWPGSGDTIYSAGSNSIAKAFVELASTVSVIENEGRDFTDEPLYKSKWEAFLEKMPFFRSASGKDVAALIPFIPQTKSTASEIHSSEGDEDSKSEPKVANG